MEQEPSSKKIVYINAVKKPKAAMPRTRRTAAAVEAKKTKRTRRSKVVDDDTDKEEKLATDPDNTKATDEEKAATGSDAGEPSEEKKEEKPATRKGARTRRAAASTDRVTRSRDPALREVAKAKAKEKAEQEAAKRAANKAKAALKEKRAAKSVCARWTHHAGVRAHAASDTAPCRRRPSPRPSTRIRSPASMPCLPACALTLQPYLLPRALQTTRLSTSRCYPLELSACPSPSSSLSPSFPLSFSLLPWRRAPCCLLHSVILLPVRPRGSASPFPQLHNIFCFVSFRMLIVLSHVCRAWRDVVLREVVGMRTLPLTAPGVPAYAAVDQIQSLLRLGLLDAHPLARISRRPPPISRVLSGCRCIQCLAHLEEWLAGGGRRFGICGRKDGKVGDGGHFFQTLCGF